MSTSLTTPEPSLSPELQRMRRMSDWTFAVMFGLMGLLMLVVPYSEWWQRLIMLPSILLAAWYAYRWDQSVRPAIAWGITGVCLATAIVCSLLDVGPYGVFGLCAVGAVGVTKLPRHQLAWTSVLVTVVLGSAALVWFTRPAVTSLYLMMAALFLGTDLFSAFLSRKSWQLTLASDAARQAERDLAVAQERFRFAADLHDIQGHTLHVVKLKAALAARLVRTDPDRAEDELRQIRDLIAGTISQTRELANAERRLTLAGEATNAENLLRAAGAEVTVRRDGTPPEWLEEPIGLVLREATTNILRHAAATRVSVRVAADGIEVVNDGCPQGPCPPLGGLAVLGERLAAWDGELTASQEDGEFTTAARFAADGVGPSAAARAAALGDQAVRVTGAGR